MIHGVELDWVGGLGMDTSDVLWVYMQVLWTRWWGFFSFFRQFEDYVVDDIRGPHLSSLWLRTSALVAELVVIFWTQLCWVI
jgi:hypothetical protein